MNLAGTLNVTDLGNAARVSISCGLAFFIVFLLFFTMQYLIKISDPGLSEAGKRYSLDFVRVPKEQVIERKKRKPRKPPEPEEPPPEPPTPQMDNINPNANTIAVSAVSVRTDISLSAGGFGLAPTDGEYLPIVKVQPIYPRRALSRGIEGHVIVEFTVTKSGTTRGIRVVESTSSMFEKAAIQAASKFKYKPRVVDGEPIEVPGVRNKITFLIED
tara:strand:- start:405 stop:1052 length:648 start_codon:yes stop_codon:yes gene_type:complete